MNKILGIVLAMFVMTGTAQADSNWYLTGGINQTDYEASVFGNSLEMNDENGWEIGAGYDFSKWLAVEIQYSDLGSGGVSINGMSSGVNAEADRWSLMAVADPTITTVAGMPLRAIGKIGVARTELDLSAGGFSANDDDTSLVYGGGISLGVTKKVDVSLLYMMNESEFFGQDVDLDTITLGVRYHF